MKLTRRGKKARALFILAGIVVFIWWMSAGLWWDGTGWCAGTMSECLAGGL